MKGLEEAVCISRSPSELTLYTDWSDRAEVLSLNTRGRSKTESKDAAAPDFIPTLILANLATTKIIVYMSEWVYN